MAKIFRGTSDANIAFDDIRGILLHLGFDERIRGSHHVYRKKGIEEKINIQRSGKQGQALSGKAGSRGITEISLGR